MITDIIFDDFSAPFSDLINKELFEVFKVAGENRWVVRRKKIEIQTSRENNQPQEFI